jgi:hypothetical protein
MHINHFTHSGIINTAPLPEKLPPGFLKDHPLKATDVTWTYCSSCGEVLPANLYLTCLLCDGIRRFGGAVEHDPLKIDWSKNYILSKGCSFCAEGETPHSIELYQRGMT